MAYAATTEGEFVIKNGRDVSIKFFTEKFILSDAVSSPEQARSIIQAGLLSDRLRRTNDNFKRWRTCEVTSFERTKDAPEHSEIDNALVEATALGCVPENIDNYKEQEAKLKALKRSIDSHRSRLKKGKKARDERDMTEVEGEE